MSLKTVYDNSNKVTDTGLSVTYRQTFTSSGYWEITRYAKKSYRFIGMDEGTAKACAAAKRSQYTRSFKRLQSSSSGNIPAVISVIECPSDIAPQHQEGDVWSVEISVNEMDVIPQVASATDPAALFAAENGRDYDEDAGSSSLTLNSASRTGDQVTVTFSSHISGFDPDSVVILYKTSADVTTWNTAGAGRTGTGTVPSTGPLYVKLKYGSVESNVLAIGV